MTPDSAPRLQRSWDGRAACNFIGGGAGTGLLLAAAAALPAGWPYFPAGALAIVLVSSGLLMVWLEIGRPLRALNVFFNPRISWMSREAALAPALIALAGIAVVMDQSLVSLPDQMRLPVMPFALAAAALGLAFLYCQARILSASRGVPAWREPALQWVIMVTGIVEGLGLLLFLALFVGPPPAWAVPATIIALMMRVGAWEHYRQRLKARAPAQAVAALSRVSFPVHLLGHALPAALLAATFIVPTAVPLAAAAGLALVGSGAWLKFAVVTRAAFTQGFSIPFVPVRGRERPGNGVSPVGSHVHPRQ
jgi:phenylacetyl-CoA:acceptor oxidoreductase subunit 2